MWLIAINRLTALIYIYIITMLLYIIIIIIIYYYLIYLEWMNLYVSI